jgi:hypothetical protein
MVNRVKTEQDETSLTIINELGAVDMDSRRLEEKTEEQEKKLNRVTRTLESLKPRIGEIDNMYEKYAYMVDVMEKKKQVLEEMMDGVNTIHSTMKDMIVNEMAGSKKQAQVISKIDIQSKTFSLRLTAGMISPCRCQVALTMLHNMKGSCTKLRKQSRQQSVKNPTQQVAATLMVQMRSMENMI